MVPLNPGAEFLESSQPFKASLNASARSKATRWPASGMTVSWAPGMDSARMTDSLGGMTVSSAPVITRVGTRIWPRRALASGRSAMPHRAPMTPSGLEAAMMPWTDAAMAGSSRLAESILGAMASTTTETPSVRTFSAVGLRAHQHQPAQRVGVRHGEGERHIAAHGMAHEDDRPRGQALNQVVEILGEPAHGDRSRPRRAFAQAPQIRRDHAVIRLEERHLLGPGGPAEGKAVDEEQRSPLALIRIGDADAIDIFEHVAFPS